MSDTVIQVDRLSKRYLWAIVRQLHRRYNLRVIFGLREREMLVKTRRYLQYEWHHYGGAGQYQKHTMYRRSLGSGSRRP